MSTNSPYLIEQLNFCERLMKNSRMDWYGVRCLAGRHLFWSFLEFNNLLANELASVVDQLH